MADEEVIDPGPPTWAGVRFVRIQHPETGGVADVPAHLVEHHRQRGWEPVEEAAPAAVEEEAPARRSRRSNQPTSSSSDDATSQED